MGKPQPIRNFEEVGLRPVMPVPALPPHVYTNLQPPAPSSAVNILLLDFANEAQKDNTISEQLSASIAMQKRVKEAARQALERMPLGTRVAILCMTNNLRILQSFTADRALLSAAIDAVPYDTDGNGDKQCVESNNRNRMVLESLDQIAASVAVIKGRKNLIWFTVGIPAITDPNDRPSCLPDYSLGLSHAYDQLTAAQVSVYPVSAVGVDRLGARELSMEMVAEATGGIAYSQSNDIASAVLKAIDNGANYYAIAFTPPSRKYNGFYHKIDVKVDRSGVQLVFRKGYYSDDLAKDKMPPGLTFSMTPPPAYAGNMKTPMSRGTPTSQQILFEVRVEPSQITSKPGDPPVLGTLNANLRGLYHMFLTVVPGTFSDWNHPRHIQHFNSKDLLHWKTLADVDLPSERTIDACIFKLNDGNWRLWYKNEAAGSHIWYSDSKDLVHWEAKGVAIKSISGEGPVVFQWRGSYWMLEDTAPGLSAFRSSDLEKWTRQPDKLLLVPGTRPTDRTEGKHPDVVIDGSGRAWLFYFTQQGGDDRDAAVPGSARRSVLHVSELHEAGGVLSVDRNAPAYVHMLPPPMNKKSDLAGAW